MFGVAHEVRTQMALRSTRAPLGVCPEQDMYLQSTECAWKRVSKRKWAVVFIQSIYTCMLLSSAAETDVPAQRHSIIPSNACWHTQSSDAPLPGCKPLQEICISTPTSPVSGSIHGAGLSPVSILMSMEVSNMDGHIVTLSFIIRVWQQNYTFHYFQKWIQRGLFVWSWNEVTENVPI